MEGLFILLGIWVLETVIKKVTAYKKRKQESQIPNYPEYDEDELKDVESEPVSNKKLEDLVRQFEEAQRQAEQGNIEPTFSDSHDTESYDKASDIDESVQDSRNTSLTIYDIALEVSNVDEVNLEFLMDVFGVDEDEAYSMVEALQKYRIIGQDMGEGIYDVLVHSEDEVKNIFARKKNEMPNDLLKEIATQKQESEIENLEDSNISAKESAENFESTVPKITNIENEKETEYSEIAKPNKFKLSKNISDIRKGFIWAKVLDEPRFKRRWNSQYR